MKWRTNASIKGQLKCYKTSFVVEVFQWQICENTARRVIRHGPFDIRGGGGAWGFVRKKFPCSNFV